MSEFYYQRKHSSFFLNTLINIRDIEITRLSSEIKLRELIRNKYNEYITHRKTMTLVDYNDNKTYNPDNDCPVCFETNPELTSGQNCEHLVCIDCFEKIVSTTNKCPICRENLENQTETETEEEDTDDEDLLFEGGSNERPTSNLYQGRRWFNIETNNIEYYYGNDLWVNNNLLTYYTFIDNYNNNSEMGYCRSCGIQQTREVNNYMREVYGGCFYFDSNVTDNSTNSFIIEWENFFDEEYNVCFDCHKMHRTLQSAFDRMD